MAARIVLGPCGSVESMNNVVNGSLEIEVVVLCDIERVIEVPFN